MEISYLAAASQKLKTFGMQINHVEMWFITIHYWRGYINEYIHNTHLFVIIFLLGECQLQIFEHSIKSLHFNHLFTTKINEG